MDKETYLEQLRFHLAGRLPVNEMNRVLQYYAQQLEQEQNDGTAVEVELGDPQKLADDLVDDYLHLKSHQEQKQAKPKKKRRWLNTIFALMLVGCIASIAANYSDSGNDADWDYPEIAESSEEYIPDDAAFVEAIAEEGYGTEYTYITTSISPGASQTFALSSFNEIDLSLNIPANITIQSGSEYSLTVTNNSNNQTIYVDDNYEILSINDDGSSAINVKSSEIVVTVPNDAYLNYIDVSNIAGNLALSNVGADNVYLTNDAGDVKLENMAANSIDITLSFGNITFSNINVSSGTNLRASSGNINLSNSQLGDITVNNQAGNVIIQNSTMDGFTDVYNAAGNVELSNVTTNGLYVDNSVGNVKLSGSFLNETYVSCGVGDISFSSDIPEEDFEVSTNVSLGDLTVNGVKRSSYDINGNGSNILTLSTSLGSIQIDW